MSDFTTGAHECFCDRQYKDANKLESCGDCPRDYIAGAWDARRKYIEEHSKMTDRYEKIRAALAMGPTPGPRRAVEQSVIGPQDLSILFAKVTFSVGINGSHSVPIEEAIANAALAAACDPDTIRELLAERDQLAAALEAARADADRYRWLKKSAFCNVWARGDGIALVAPRTPVADIDSRIDAAIDLARWKGAE